MSLSAETHYHNRYFYSMWQEDFANTLAQHGVENGRAIASVFGADYPEYELSAEQAAKLWMKRN